MADYATLLQEAMAEASAIVQAVLSDTGAGEADQDALRAAYEQVASAADLDTLDSGMAAFVAKYGQDAWDKQERLGFARLAKEQG